jgi:chromosome segregation ATPase
MEVAFAICLVIVALAIGNYVGAFGKQTEIDEYKEKVEEFEQRVEEVITFSDSIQRQQNILTDSIVNLEQEKEQSQQEADRYRITSTRLSQKLDSLRTSMVDVDLDSVPPPVVEYISLLETQVDTLEAEVTALRGALDVSNSQVLVWESKFNLEAQKSDSLQVVINTFPTDVPDPDRLFGVIRLPSRTSSFLVGGVMGVIGGITLASNF